jgi:hypothetical protein
LRLLIPGNIVREKLEGVKTAELGVFWLVNHAHATAP